ncbi:MAG: hypothetical protein D6706_18240 [Chloroflexi bacterium]|nr:MAG: hypothetical protein D6706_18240 [Chloroflexota bacterium]
MGKTNAERLREFQTAVGDQLPDVPTPPDEATLALRRTLITEEYKEVMDALSVLETAETDVARDQALVMLAHELADLLYVTYGTMVACGIDADAVFAEVHRANMAKLSGPRRADGKLLKPPDWQPADVAGVLARQKARNGHGS